MGILNWVTARGTARGLAPIVDRPVRVLGIDLGTTNSVMTDIVWDPQAGGEPSITVIEVPQKIRQDGVASELNRELVPSVVALVDGVELVGEGAHRLRSDLLSAGLAPNASIWWEQKNWMGTSRSYPAAPEGYRTPKEIAARILSHLMEAVRDDGGLPIDRVVITVPASFQITQRADTRDAAAAAGIALESGDLLDEPVAAFLDHLSSEGLETLPAKERSNVMVLDFGGGTSDVALLQVTRKGDAIDVARRSVSRFHRVGGGDLDIAIANEVLLPRLLEEHGIKPFEFNFKQKRDFILPALSSLAEKLKIKLSQEVKRLESLDKLPADPGDVQVQLPTPFTFRTGNKDHPQLSLAAPSLSHAEFRRATDPFLRRNASRPIGKEYYTVTSIFSPVDDAMRAAEWTPAHIDVVLLIGGSSTPYTVTEAIKDAFRDALLLTYTEALDAQRSISRGAAIHALFKTVFDANPIASVLAEDLEVLTDAGPETVVAAGTQLPFPPDGAVHVFDQLRVPETRRTGTLNLRFEFVSGGRRLVSRLLALRAPLEENGPLPLHVRISEDQVIDLTLVVPHNDGPEQQFEVQLDNPFAITANPNEQRERILQLEQQVTESTGVAARRKIREIAAIHQGLREYERARQLLEGLLPGADASEAAGLLNQLGLVCKAMGDQDGHLDYLRQAIAGGDTGAAGFNLALALKDRREFAEALKAIDANIAVDDDPPARVLRGEILRGLERKADADEEYERALQMSDDARAARTEFELGWVRAAAQMLSREEIVADINKRLDTLRTSRQDDEPTRGGGDGLLPRVGGGSG